MKDYTHLMSPDDQARIRRGMEVIAEIKANKLAKGDYFGYLCMFPSEESGTAFLKICHLVPDSKYWRLLAGAWTRLEVSYPQRHLWLACFNSVRPGREKLMKAKERRKLAALSDSLTVFRGYAGGVGKMGLSWTLSRERAEFFAKVYATGSRRASFGFDGHQRSPMLATGQCWKESVLAYFADRKEEEIVIDPKDVFSVRSRRI